MRRATRCFSNFDLEFQSFAVDQITKKKQFWDIQSHVPNVKTLIRWSDLTKEVIGLLVYKSVDYAA